MDSILVEWFSGKCFDVAFILLDNRSTVVSGIRLLALARCNPSLLRSWLVMYRFSS